MNTECSVKGCRLFAYVLIAIKPLDHSSLWYSYGSTSSPSKWVEPLLLCKRGLDQGLCPRMWIPPHHCPQNDYVWWVDMGWCNHPSQPLLNTQGLNPVKSSVSLFSALHCRSFRFTKRRQSGCGSRQHSTHWWCNRCIVPPRYVSGKFVWDYDGHKLVKDWWLGNEKTGNRQLLCWNQSPWHLNAVY